MQVTETKNEGLTREYAIVIAADDIENRVLAKLEELKTQVQLPGFRPGKVPTKLLRQRYGQAVLDEVIQDAVVETSSQAMTDNEIQPAMQPKMDIGEFEDGKDLEYTMAVEVMPEIEPMDFKSLELERLVVPAGDEEVDKALGNIANEIVRSEPIKRARKSRKDDIVVIDFVGSVDGEDFEGGTAEDYQLTLGAGRFIPGFEDQLIGAKPNDHVTVNVTFPEEYPAENLKGKEAVFEVDVKEIQVRVETPVDDELAKSLGLESLDQLRDSTREQIENDYGVASRNLLKRTLFDKLSDAHDFEIPPGMLESETQSIWEQFEAARRENEVDEADKEKSDDELRAEYEVIARRRVSLGLLLAEVGQKNNIEVTAEEVNRALLQEVRRYPGQERQIMEFYQQNEQAMASLRAPLFEDKVTDFIIEIANISDTEVTADELAARMSEGDETAEAEAETEKKPAKKNAPKKKAPKKKAKPKAKTAKKADE